MQETIHKLNNRNVIKISHELNYARFNLGIISLDIVYALISQIKNEDTALNYYHISITALEKVLGRKLNRLSLKKAQEELLNEPIIFGKQKNPEPFTWLKTFDINSRLGSIQIELHPMLTEHLISPEYYAMGNLADILPLKSQYSKRIYMVCSQFVTMRKFSISLGVLRHILKLPLSMEVSHGNFKARVLEPAIASIRQATSLRVTYSEIKMGNRITDLEFVIYKPTKEKGSSKRKSGVIAVEEWLQANSEPDAIDTEIVPWYLCG